MAVTLGGIELDPVLSWDGEAASTIPVKRVIRKQDPTSQSQYWCRTPREIILIARVTLAIKESLVALKNLHGWQLLYDYDGVTLIDSVWIMKVGEAWKGDEDETAPWLVTLQLLCSTT